MNQTMIPEQVPTITCLAPAADAGGRTGKYISLKNAEGVAIVVHVNQGNAATVALTPNQATNVAAAGEKVTGAVQIYANQDEAAGQDLVKQTDAANFTTDAGVKEKCVVFIILASMLDVAGGFDCITLKTGASNAANITEARYYLLGERYKQALPPSSIID